MSVDVPESTQTHLDQTVKNWPLGQTLVISGGIHPGILDKKGGWFNLQIPGTYPTGTEVLVFLDAETVTRAKAASRSAETRNQIVASGHPLAFPQFRQRIRRIEENSAPDR